MKLDTLNMDDEIARLKALIAEKDALLTALITEKETLLANKDALITEKEALLANKDALITEKDALLANKDALITEKDALLANKDAIIQAIKNEAARHLDFSIQAVTTAVTLLRENNRWDLACLLVPILDELEIRRKMCQLDGADATAGCLQGHTRYHKDLENAVLSLELEVALMTV